MFKTLMAYLRWLLVAGMTVILVSSGVAFADDDDDDDDDDGSQYQTYVSDALSKSVGRSSIHIRLEPMGFGLMGDSRDAYTGALNFGITDVSLPGNSSLPVEIKRIAKNPQSSYAQKFFMADWDLFIPNKMDINDGSGGWTNETVTTFQHGTEVVYQSSYGYDFNSHYGHDFDQPRWKPYTRSNLSLVTPSHTVVTNNGTITPDGTKYTFGKRITRSAGDLYVDYPDRQNVRTVRQATLNLATEITDVNGNWVKYTYTADGKVTRIYSNDGRSISLSYLSGTKYVSSVTANGRTWNYYYKTTDDPDRHASATRKVLWKVKQPDGKFWEYNIENLTTDKVSEMYENRIDASEASIWVKHPYGTRADYTLAEKRLDLASVPWSHNTLYHKLRNGYWKKSKAVLDKKITLATNETYKWSYKYNECTISFPFGDGFGTYTRWNMTRASCTTQREKINPDGSKIVSTHVGLGNTDTGKPRSIKSYNASGSLLKEVSYQYEKSMFPIGADSSSADVPDGEEWDNSNLYYLSKKITKQNGDTYTKEYEYDTDPWSANYSYGKPISSKSYSNVSTTPRETITFFTHVKNRWVLNLPTKMVTNGRETSSFTYDGLGRKKTQSMYGQLEATFGYHSNAAYKGALYWSKNALGRISYFYNWKNGTAQRIRRPDNSNDYYYVDNNGWATSTKDARGFTVSYQRDSMGRVTRVIPSKSKKAWADTAINYSFGNQVVQTITHGQSRETITYDSLFRELLERKQSLTGGTEIYRKTEYDLMGRAVFASFPSSSPNPTTGTNRTYDGLGRLRTVRENVSPFAETKYDFLNGHRRRVTDSLNNQTIKYFDGYSGPDGGDLLRILQPMGVNTYLNRNQWGQLTSLRQNGSHDGYAVDKTQNYYYDNRQRLCRHTTPEGGSALMAYNAIGNMTSYSKGMPTGSSCASPSGSSKVTISFDILERPILTNFTDSNTPDIQQVYDVSGNVIRLNRGGANWTYTYDDFDNVATEKLTIDGRNFNMAYTFNNSGHLTKRTLPGGRVVNFIADGLGRATSVKNGSANVATSIDYHASGAVSGLTYGNGQVFTQTLNARLQPSRIRSRKGSTTALDLQYAYDVRGKVTGITNRAVTGQNKTFGYDSLGRLTTANGPWGTGSYKYDALGNIRQKKLGSRTINMTYDSGRNRLSSHTDSAGPNRSLAYDTRGNVTSLGTLAFIYDMADQPRTVSGGSNGSYKYDGNLKRVKAVIDGKTTYNVYDASGALVHVDQVSANRKTDYIGAGGQTLARVTNNTVTYLHPDHLGSAQSGTTPTGAVKWRQHFNPYGATRNDVAENDNLAGFGGHIKDAATGLNYMQARYYDPVLGRFLSIDPIGFSAERPFSFNRYAYAGNDPVGGSDPDGEFVNFVVKFAADVALEVAIQVATGQEIDLGAAAKGAAIGVLDPTKTARKAAKLAGALNDVRKTRSAAKATPGASCAICFVAGTSVYTEDGLKPIELVKIGDKVWAWDEITGDIKLKDVIDTIPSHEREIWSVSLKSPAKTSGNIIETTHEHPWWVIGQGWVETQDLKAGMFVRTHEGQGIEVLSVNNTNRIQSTFNLTVDDYATYFVGEDKLLVHNCRKAQGPPNVTASKTNGRRSDGTPQTRVTVKEADGTIKDVTRERTKASTPNNHPNAPAGTRQKTDFGDDALPRSKGQKREPTEEELGFLDHFDDDSTTG